MEGSGPGNGERRARRTGILIGFLVAAVIALGVALAVVVIGDDSDDDDSPTTSTSATTPPPSTAPRTTVTTTPPPTQPTTPTTPAGPTIDQIQAKSAAQRGASQEAGRMGIGIPPPEWDARCTALGGTDRSGSWTCQVAANGGQCSGTITAVARAPGVAATRNPRVACGE